MSDSDFVDDIKELREGEEISVMIDRGIIEYLGPTCYTTYVGFVKSVKDKVLTLQNAKEYTQIVGRVKDMPGSPRLYIYPPEKNRDTKEIVIKKWYYMHRGIFFEWIINVTGPPC